MHSVMIVDNEAIIRKGLSQCFNWTSLGCKVTDLAADGAEALEKLQANQVDILISDIRMPGIDGLALTREVRKRFPDIKIILVTAYTDFEYAQEALRQQVVDFIIKPTSEEKLRNAVMRAKAMLNQDRHSEDLKRSLHEEHTANLFLQQKLFLEGLIAGNNLSNLYTRTESARLHIDLIGSRLAFVRIDCSVDEGEDRLSGFVEESRRYFSTVFLNHQIIMLSSEASGFLTMVSAQPEIELTALLDEYVSLIDSMTEFNVQIGVSSPIDSILNMRDAAREARDAFFYLSYEGHQVYMLFDHVPQANEEVTQEIRDLLRQTNEAFIQQNLSSIEKAIHSFEILVRRERLPLSEVSRFMSLLYNICINTLINFDLKAAFEKGLLPKEDEFLRDLRIDDLSTSFLTLARESLDIIRLEERGAEGSVQFVQNYIRLNLEKDLTLDRLAAFTHLSPGYLSRQFKRNVGKNLSTFISNQRIERAKALLEKGDQKNYEVAQAVGIEDPVYFSRVFRKTTGLSPSEYRLQKESQLSKRK